MRDKLPELKGEDLIRAMLARMDEHQLSALVDTNGERLSDLIVDERQYRADTNDRDIRFDCYEYHHGSGEAA